MTAMFPFGHPSFTRRHHNDLLGRRMYPHSWSVCYSHLDYSSPAKEADGDSTWPQKGSQQMNGDLPRRTAGGALTGEGRAYVFSQIAAMNNDGLHWLTPMLLDMVEGDPWQEARAALDIVEAWEKRNHG